MDAKSKRQNYILEVWDQALHYKSMFKVLFIQSNFTRYRILDIFQNNNDVLEQVFSISKRTEVTVNLPHTLDLTIQCLIQ